MLSAYHRRDQEAPPMPNLVPLDLVCVRWFAKIPSPQGRRAEPDV